CLSSSYSGYPEPGAFHPFEGGDDVAALWESPLLSTGIDSIVRSYAEDINCVTNLGAPSLVVLAVSSSPLPLRIQPVLSSFLSGLNEDIERQGTGEAGVPPQAVKPRISLCPGTFMDWRPPRVCLPIHHSSSMWRRGRPLGRSRTPCSRSRPRIV